MSTIETATFAPEPGAAVRRVTAERQRTRMRGAASAAMRTVLAAALSALLSYGGYRAFRWATASPLFALSEVRFSGNAHASEAELLRRSGLAPGDNLFHADLARAARGIEAHPWVVSARLERRLPRTIVVDVLEHRPAALVQLGALYVLDDQGRLFKRASADDRLDLPLVTGLARADWDTRRLELQLRLFTALQLLDAWRAEGFAVAQLSEVRVEDDGSLSIVAHDGEGMQDVRLGAGEFSLKLKRLTQIRSALARRGERASRVDLDNPSRPDQATAALAQKHR